MFVKQTYHGVGENVVYKLDIEISNSVNTFNLRVPHTS